jgi:hypothetical protein
MEKGNTPTNPPTIAETVRTSAGTTKRFLFSRRAFAL